MVLSSAPKIGPSVILLEGSLTAIAIAVAFCWPRLGSSFFPQIEMIFRRLARKKGLSVLIVGITALALRLAILPLCPIPLPFIPDDFSFLLAADTFASGRLTNPTPAMWMHFETMHVTMRPTYMSMYFPAQGLLLAAGRVLAGHPWYGILVMTALMCAAICWMLQAWLPPSWALLGGVLAILRLGLFSSWINTYTGAGSITTLGGALVLGAFPRFMKEARLRDGMLLAVGVILLGTCRPYDAMLLCLPVALVLTRSIFFGKNRAVAAKLLRSTLIPLTLILAAGMWMGYYDYRAFGNPLTLSYTVDRAQYATAPYFIWQSKRPEPIYRHKMMRDSYRIELEIFAKIHSRTGFGPETLVKAGKGLLFFAGIALLPPLIMTRRVLLDRRVRFLVLCVLVLIAGQLVEVFLLHYYLAPFVAAFYAIGLQAMRHLRVWRPNDQPVGMTLVRLTVTLCVVLAGVRLYAEPLHLDIPIWPGTWAAEWYGQSSLSGVKRAQIESRLEQMPGRQLVIVRYPLDHSPLDEWVYNAANIDSSKVVWAREMDEAENLQLIHYYKDRTVWLVQPDTKPASVSLYLSAPGQPINAGR
jgi:hypothetical protein